jgi:hypothetical protein
LPAFFAGFQCFRKTMKVKSKEAFNFARRNLRSISERGQWRFERCIQAEIAGFTRWLIRRRRVLVTVCSFGDFSIDFARGNFASERKSLKEFSRFAFDASCLTQPLNRKQRAENRRSRNKKDVCLNFFITCKGKRSEIKTSAPIRVLSNLNF